VLPVASRVTFMENGRNVETMPVDVLRADPGLAKKYVGVS